LAREKIRLPLFYKEKHLTGWDAFLLCFRNDTFDWRWRRRSELLYKYKNDPYIESLREGKLDTPEERYIKFFENRRRFNEFTGIKKIKTLKKRLI